MVKPDFIWNLTLKTISLKTLENSWKLNLFKTFHVSVIGEKGTTGIRIANGMKEREVITSQWGKTI